MSKTKAIKAEALMLILQRYCDADTDIELTVLQNVAGCVVTHMCELITHDYDKFGNRLRLILKP